MHSPAHPGQILEELYIKSHNLTITEVAGALGIARKNLYAVINGGYAVSVDMAFKLSKLFGTTPDFWLQAQMNYDLSKGYKSASQIKTQSLTGILICKAINKRQQIEFTYNDRLRIVEPQFYGIGKKETEQLRGYQINENPKVEKLFDVDKISDFRLLLSYFTNLGPNYNSKDSAFTKAICKLK
jgi:addiction module HigA family antidote